MPCFGHGEVDCVAGVHCWATTAAAVVAVVDVVRGRYGVEVFDDSLGQVRPTQEIGEMSRVEFFGVRNPPACI